ncbi:MAG TPA: ATP-binding protein, partial [Tenuifilaceae bacterium]|nr:ATP-binding protein [Tenuifilaceae bacterium]
INDCTQMDLPLLVEKVAEMIEERSNSSSSTKEMLEQVEFLLAVNKDNPFIGFVNSNIKSTTNKCLVLSLSLLSFKRQMLNSLEGITSSIFDNLSEQLEYEQNLLTQNNELTRNGIIRFVESEFVDEKVPTLSDKTIKLLYADYPELKVELELDGIIRSNKITAKKLFYDSNLSEQIKKLIRTISQNHYEEVQSKLTQNGLPTGITAMFYGSSGTGKTETIYQIARITGRDIMMVDLSQVKSKWFGESEKRVKKIFDDYNRLYNNYTIKPILFINEADGMFTKRLTNGISSTDQAVNTMQNIILQSLENFNGILLATTNLSANLDSALERRFLFKIEFKNPHPNTSQRIWKSKIPELKPSYIKLLSKKYQLSGGEIENVARKYFMDKIIHNKNVTIEQIISYCEQEKPFQNQRKIGF